MKVNENGFSLIELLVVISLIGIIGVLTSQIFILGFKSLGKSEIIKELKQSGGYAVNVIKQSIQESNDIYNIDDICNTTYDELNLLNSDGNNTVFRCEDNRISSEKVYANPLTPAAKNYLTSGKIVVENCTFRVVCPTPPLSPKYVFISFQARQLGDNVPLEKRATMNFQTTVSFRSYQ
jgi:prepilin-type N-terminal cleavage/methylation domain-containing protein